MIKKAYAYLRVSSEEQVSNFSLENQLDYCVREADRQDYQIEKIYSEEGQSGKNTNRPQLIQLLEDCRINQSQISAIFIYRIDRMSRDTADYLAIKRKLAQYGIRILSVTEPVEDSPTGEFLETLLAATAKLDNATKALRTIDGMRKRVESGLPNGKASVGYLNVTKDEKQIIEPDPDQFNKVKKAWDEMATGAYSLETIVPIMKKLGIILKRGKRTFPIERSQQTQRIFRDKFYCGYVVSKKFGIDKRGSHIPMILEDQFYKVQSIIDKRSFTAGLHYKKQHEDFPLRGQVICSLCNLLMTGSWSKGRKNKYAYYFCGQKKHKSPSIGKDKFEDEYLELMRSIEPKKEFVVLFSEMVKEKWQERYQGADRTQKVIEDDLEALYELRSILAEKNLKGLYPDDLFGEQLAKIEDEILVKKTLQSETKLQKIDINIVMDFMNSFLCNIAKAWKEGDQRQRKMLTGSIFPENVTYNYPGFGTKTLGLPFNLIKELEVGTLSLGVAEGN